jgi:hypothetical protein
MTTTTNPDVPLPAGAVFGDVWEDTNPTNGVGSVWFMPGACLV